MNCIRSFNYYIRSAKSLQSNSQISSEFFECIVGVNDKLPDYLIQDLVTPLANNSAIVIGQNQFSQLLNSNFLFNDFKVFFFFQLNHSINDPKRYEKQYPSSLPIDQLSAPNHLNEQLFYQKTAWKDILNINPDLLLVKNDDTNFYASKDTHLLDFIVKK